jgi:hypothetical protein
MNKLAFTPTLDIPLAAIALAIFIWHCNRWALQRHIDTSVNVVLRLPTARLRVVFAFACFLFLCWLLNLAFWSILLVLFGVGLAFAIAFGGDMEGGTIGLLGPAYLIREWAFGFPQLILLPQRQATSSLPGPHAPSDLVGKIGVTTSPLRPVGDADIEGIKHTVMSFDGSLLDVGTKVTVMSYRNGCPCVAPVPMPDQAANQRLQRSP